MPVHGSKAVFKLGTASAPNTVTDISQYLTRVRFPAEIEVHESQGLGATAKSYVVGLADHTISIEGRWDPPIDAHLAGIKQLVVAFEYGPQGSTTGSPKYTGQAILTSYEQETAVDDVAGFSAELQVTGNVTRGTY